MHIERLKRLYDIVAATKPEATDIRHWRTSGIGDCGTLYCFGGLAAQDPVFQSEGLTAWVRGCPLFNNKAGYDALANFFDISDAQADFLFSAATYYIQYDSITELDRPLIHAEFLQRLSGMINGEQHDH